MPTLREAMYSWSNSLPTVMNVLATYQQMNLQKSEAVRMQNESDRRMKLYDTQITGAINEEERARAREVREQEIYNFDMLERERVREEGIANYEYLVNTERPLTEQATQSQIDRDSAISGMYNDQSRVYQQQFQNEADLIEKKESLAALQTQLLTDDTLTPEKRKELSNKVKAIADSIQVAMGNVGYLSTEGKADAYATQKTAQIFGLVSTIQDLGERGKIAEEVMNMPYEAALVELLKNPNVDPRGIESIKDGLSSTQEMNARFYEMRENIMRSSGVQKPVGFIQGQDGKFVDATSDEKGWRKAQEFYNEALDDATNSTARILNIAEGTDAYELIVFPLLSPMSQEAYMAKWHPDRVPPKPVSNNQPYAMPLPEESMARSRGYGEPIRVY